jgi:hypothetical protein
VFDRSPAGWLKAATCANGEEPNVEGHLDASPAIRHEVLVNLRAKATPARARAIVETQLKRLASNRSISGPTTRAGDKGDAGSKTKVRFSQARAASARA